jgi:hypothetical protein
MRAWREPERERNRSCPSFGAGDGEDPLLRGPRPHRGGEGGQALGQRPDGFPAQHAARIQREPDDAVGRVFGPGRAGEPLAGFGQGRADHRNAEGVKIRLLFAEDPPRERHALRVGQVLYPAREGAQAIRVLGQGRGDVEDGRLAGPLVRFRLVEMEEHPEEVPPSASVLLGHGRTHDHARVLGPDGVEI